MTLKQNSTLYGSLKISTFNKLEALGAETKVHGLKPSTAYIHYTEAHMRELHCNTVWMGSSRVLWTTSLVRSSNPGKKKDCLTFPRKARQHNDALLIQCYDWSFIMLTLVSFISTIPCGSKSHCLAARKEHHVRHSRDCCVSKTLQLVGFSLSQPFLWF